MQPDHPSRVIDEPAGDTERTAHIGATGITKRRTDLQPPGQDVPPFFIAHGDADCVVPHQQSADLHDAIEAVAPGRSQLIIVADSGHYLDFDFDFQSVSEALVTFLNATIGTPAGS